MAQMILGVDPGFTGALCVIAKSDNGGGLISILDMPLLQAETLTSRTKHRALNAHAIHSWLKSQPPIQLAVIERVQSMPGQGIASTFRFGEGYGILQGILASLQIRTLKTPPAVWKAKLNLTSNKQESLDLARKLAPNYSHLFALRKNDGRAEAFLLAYFGARSLGLDFTGGNYTHGTSTTTDLY